MQRANNLCKLRGLSTSQSRPNVLQECPQQSTREVREIHLKLMEMLNYILHTIMTSYPYF